MLGKLVVGVALALIFFWALGGRRGATQLAAADAKALVAQGAKLVDVRTPQEFAAGHLAGAVNIPLAEVPAQLQAFGAKERPIVIYCRSGNRSAQAAAILQREGFTAIHDLGAMSRW